MFAIAGVDAESAVSIANGAGPHAGRNSPTDSHFKCDTKSLVQVVPTVKEGTARVTG